MFRCPNWTRAAARVARPSVGWCSLPSAALTARWPFPTPAWRSVPGWRPGLAWASTRSYLARQSSLPTTSCQNTSRASSLYKTVTLRRTRIFDRCKNYPLCIFLIYIMTRKFSMWVQENLLIDTIMCLKVSWVLAVFTCVALNWSLFHCAVHMYAYCFLCL